MQNNQKILDAIKEYQVPGSVNDFNESNFKQEGVGCEWSDHHPGTFMMPQGLFFLGMPKGFNRLGSMQGNNKEYLKINIFENWEHFKKQFGEYDKFNIPCWKYLNENKHTFIRGLSPRINYPFLHIILEDCMDKINCLEITEKDLKEMD